MPEPGPGDAVLVERLRSDEPAAALRALFRRYGGELYGFALQVLGDRDAAEAAVEEVFVRAWRHAARYDPDGEAVRGWLYAFARDAVADAREGRAERGETLDRVMLGWQVAAALERLAPAHRQMIRMVQVRGMTTREIAAHTGLPLGTVTSRTGYALRSLRLVLDEMGVTPP